MAIQFARCEYVSRSSGGNACRKASYNQRETVKCERTGVVFSFKERGGNLYHEILLPTGAHEKFKQSSVLWNEAERCERRKDSQVAREFVIALPDDKQLSLEDRIELTKRFASTYFVEKGLAVQLDLHEPHEKHEVDEKGAENWHAHLLVTTRRFTEDGLGLSDKKARDLDPEIRKGLVVEADIWGELWRDLQNAYFEEKGYDLRVDPIGILPQEHLGPVRMRHHMNEALLRSKLLEKANEKLAQDPTQVIQALIQTKAYFKQDDIAFFLKKHVPEGNRESLLAKVLTHKDVLHLYTKETGESTGYLTTQKVRAEEEKLIRFVDQINKKRVSPLKEQSIISGQEGKRLSAEQKMAYDHCVISGQNLCILQGRAGVGKSYILDAIRKAHEEEGYRVLGLAPSNKVAMDLKENGFKEAKTCHAFLFAFKNNRESLNSNTLVIVEEAGMLGTELSVELFNALRKSSAKLVLVGDDRQLSSVERGGAFSYLADRYGSVELKEVRRQIIDWQKAVSEDFSKGDVKSAVQVLEENKAILWSNTKEEVLSSLLKTWSIDQQKTPHGTMQLLAHRNVDVDALNQGAREILRQKGNLGDFEITCMTERGLASFAEGDRVHLTKTDKKQGLFNGTFGRIEKIDPETNQMTVLFDNKERKELNPQTYEGLRHGYASTVYKAQGATLDHVYVLHGRMTNQSINYVSLTRQTKSLSLHVAKEEATTLPHLIKQMSREEGKGLSLVYETQNEIEKKRDEKALSTQITERIEKVATKVKDAFHKNEGFYHYQKPSTLPQEDVWISSPIFTIQEKSFNEIKDLCERRLFEVFKKDNDRLPTKDEMKELLSQTTRTAELVMYQFALKNQNPTYTEMKLISGRAGFELSRLSEIREELIEEWREEGGLTKSDGLKAHMLAQRLSIIEGRLFLEAKEKGLTKPTNLADCARDELNTHINQTRDLSIELSKKYVLPNEASIACANNVMRFKESYGEEPSKDIFDKMVSIVQEISSRHDGIAQKDKVKTVFKQRVEADLTLRQTINRQEPLQPKEQQLTKNQAKAQLNEVNSQLKQMIAVEKERGIIL